MARLVTIFTGQWGDMPLETVCQKMKEFGYDGLEIMCAGEHLDSKRAAVDIDYCKERLALLSKYNLQVKAIACHLAGQLTTDPNFDSRSDGFAPKETHGDAEKKRQWAIDYVKNTAKAAKNLGVKVVTGFTGSPIWHKIYSFPPISQKELNEGYEYFAKIWNPILDVYKECGVKFALEVHPTEIAFDIITFGRALKALNNRPEFGINFDPSHLIWQGINPVKLIEAYPDRIFHVHMKDAAVTLDGVSGILGSHLDFGDLRRGWNFRSLGHGDVKFEEIIRALNAINYQGPLSVEWEDSGMNREHGAKEAAAFVKKADFKPSEIAFDAAFTK
jgi:sugar phosphate isomerase/epimerase